MADATRSHQPAQQGTWTQGFPNKCQGAPTSAANGLLPSGRWLRLSPRAPANFPRGSRCGCGLDKSCHQPRAGPQGDRRMGLLSATPPGTLGREGFSWSGGRWSCPACCPPWDVRIRLASATVTPQHRAGRALSTGSCPCEENRSSCTHETFLENDLSPLAVISPGLSLISQEGAPSK